MNYTKLFNAARQQRGLQPVNCTIDLVCEGTLLKCGCPVHNSSLSHFMVYHNPECQSTLNPKPTKWIVGKPLAENGQAVATLLGDVIGLTNPWLGLWPHEIKEELDDSNT